MKTVNNIKILEGLSANGWDIKAVSEDNDKTIGGNYYVFHFGIKNFNRADYEIEVFLSRNKNSRNEYEMFVMGWAGTTAVYINDNDWTKPNFILYYITECLRNIPYLKIKNKL